MAVLNVEKSINNRVWEHRQVDESVVQTLVQKFDLPEILARVLVARGIGEDKVETYIEPKLRDGLPDPMMLKDMKKAVDRLTQAVLAGDKVGIIGDYDVDGATSSSLLKLFLAEVNTESIVYIPDREDGYGPNKKLMQKLYDDGVRLVVTVDCGMTAFEPVDFGAQLGMDIIILDHHEPEQTLPNAYAIVNPKRLDEDPEGPCRFLAAVGVVFLTVMALNRALREAGRYQTDLEPDLRQWLDLVAFGTVCDVVSLTGVNRLFVKSGLKRINKGENIGLAALADVAKIKEKIGAYHLGYILGPRVNAAGRVGPSDLGMRLLSCEDDGEAALIAEQLESLNIKRREIEAQVLQQAIVQAEKSLDQNLPYVLVQGDDWHQGVVGIVAGRLKERYHAPTFVLSVEKGEIKGSSRSIRGVDLGALVIEAMGKGILTKGGGHPMAAGFSLNADKLDEFKAFLLEFITNAKEKMAVNLPVLEIDDVLDIMAAQPSLLQKLSVLEPYGEGNVEPCFAIPDVSISKALLTKTGHVVCKLTGKRGGRLDAVCFRSADTELGKALLNANRNTICHLAGRLRLDTWNEIKKVQLLIDDAAFM